MNLTERTKGRILVGALAAITLVASHVTYKGHTLRSKVERAADKNNDFKTSIDEWKLVYDSLGKKAPIDLVEKAEKRYDIGTKTMGHPADGLSTSDMKRYLANSQ